MPPLTSPSTHTSSIAHYCTFESVYDWMVSVIVCDDGMDYDDDEVIDYITEIMISCCCYNNTTMVHTTHTHPHTQTNIQTDRHARTHAHTHTHTQIDSQTQAHRQTDRQTHIHNGI